MKQVIIIIVFFLQIASFCRAQTIWTGAVDTDWHKPCNWNTNAVPTCSNNVIIPSVTNKPTVSSTACFLNLELQTGANLTVLSPTLLQQGCPCTPTITGGGGSGTITFNYTGGSQTWTVPPCITTISVNVKGAQGGNGGNGAQVTGTLSVTSGQVLQIKVGGAGSCPGAGYNGGGSGQSSGCGFPSCGGGGASDIIISSNRVVVAGGGGGRASGSSYVAGGAGGCVGTAGSSLFAVGGGGGTQSSGGAGGSPYSGGGWGSSGTLGVGGNGATDPCYGTAPGGGGGGGFYGGGGGGSDCFSGCSGMGGAGGGGGSCLVPVGGSCAAGIQAGNGQVTITW